MVNVLKNLLGLTPKLTDDGAYDPSPLALKLATSDVTDYEEIEYSKLDKKYKILILCSEQTNVPMTNGTYFSSGNHPVETLVPMLHLQSAGFDFEIATPTGQPVKFEMWAMPKKIKMFKQFIKNIKLSLISQRAWLNWPRVISKLLIAVSQFIFLVDTARCLDCPKTRMWAS